MPNEFKMPAVEVGDIVLWYGDGNVSTAPCPAIVTKATEANVALVCFDDAYVMGPKVGVMHVDDPRVRQHPDERGGWDFRPKDKAKREAAESRQLKKAS